MSTKRNLECLVIAAMKQELIGFVQNQPPNSLQTGDHRQITWYWEPPEFSGKIGFWCCGVGRKRSIKSIRKALSVLAPKRILVVGYSGSLLKSCAVGDIVIVERTSHETLPPKTSPCVFDPQFTELIEKRLTSTGLTCFRGTAVTVDYVVDSLLAKQHLNAVHNAVCVDMESVYIASIAEADSIPVSMIRVISDQADESLGLNFKAIPSGKWPFRLYFASHPWRLPGLYRLHLNMRLATRHLTAAVRSVLESV